MDIVVLKDRILVEWPTEGETRTLESGLIVSEQDPHFFVEVLGVGDAISDLEPGDEILIGRKIKKELIRKEGTKYAIIRYRDVLCKRNPIPRK
jgi:co-chaperonin GroES (HSP10)